MARTAIKLMGEIPAVPPLTAVFPKMGGIHYLEFLKWLHATRKPDWYLEIGTASGQSLELSSARSIAIDPAFRIRRDIHAGKRELHCFQMTSDDFFASGAAERLGAKIDLAFLDGLHLFEFLLRDFIGTEKISNPGGMILLHDCVPMSFVAAERDWDKSQTMSWTGDVWKLLPILRKYRPDLKIEVVACPPSGLVLVTGLAAGNRVLERNYDAIIAEFVPQTLDPGTLPAFVASLRLASAEDVAGPAIRSPRPIRPNAPFRLAIKIPARRRMMAAFSGEYHFAVSLAAAMRRLGHKTRIDCLKDWSSARVSGEAELLLRGIRPMQRQGDNAAVMWVLSHAGTLGGGEIAAMDHVWVASQPAAESLAAADANVSELLHCTDTGIFRPAPAGSGPSSEILFVGNAYPDRLANGIVPRTFRTGRKVHVYGRLWDSLLPGMWQGKNIANVDLGRHYASAGVVLNDHHASMRETGFVNNRIFDVLACGVPIVSDRVTGLPADLAEYVYFADTDEELGACIDSALSESAERRRQRRQFADYIHEHHSFDQRAKVIEARIREILANSKGVSHG